MWDTKLIPLILADTGDSGSDRGSVSVIVVSAVLLFARRRVLGASNSHLDGM